MTLSSFLDRFGTLPCVRRILLPVAVLGCLFLASPAGAAPAFRDTVLSANAPRSLQATAEWGGPTVATDGETVTIYFSDTYPVDPVRAKQWADFLTSLIHGPELATVSVHFAPPNEVQRLCGLQALACYSSNLATIVAPPVDPAIQTSAKGVLAHEYGHHIAAGRLNPPFVSVDYGTKRWATYENVCARASTGDLYPGAEDSRHYMLNPGEAFAESYRLLNEQRLGLTPEAWNIVTPSLYPDATALSLLEQDVVTPWPANTVRRLTAKLNAKVRTRTYDLSTPYDGMLTVLPTQAGSAKVTVSLLASGSVFKTRSFRRAKGESLSTTVCGQRDYGLRVSLAGTVAKTAKTTVTLSLLTP